MTSLMLKDELPLAAECGLEQPHLLGETGKCRKTRHFVSCSTILSKDTLLRLS